MRVQAEADKRDDRLPGGGIEQPEKPPGNCPGMKSDRVSGYFPGGDVDAPTQAAPSGEGARTCVQASCMLCAL